MQEIYQVEGKLSVAWCEEAKAIIGTWENYFISLEELKEAVLVKGLNHAKTNIGIAWIVDSSKAKGTFSQKIQDFVGTEVFPAFAANGIKYFITIAPQNSALTKLTVDQYSAKIGPNGLKLLEVNNVGEAIEWLKLQQRNVA